MAEAKSKVRLRLFRCAECSTEWDGVDLVERCAKCGAITQGFTLPETREVPANG